ncbi:MAG: hypothetical protein RJB66_1654 [Pseudomonadota bacterium]
MKKLRIYVYFLWLVTLLSAAKGFAADPAFTYQGRIIKPDGLPLQAAQVEFTLSIEGPASLAKPCLMYTEKFTADMSSGDGGFSLLVGRGQRTDDSNFALAKIFSNSLIYPVLPQCENGYVKQIGDALYLKVSFNTGSGAQTLIPLEITHTPYSLETANVAGVPSEQVLRVDNAVAAAPMSNTNYSLNLTDFTDLLAIINGTSTKYMKSTGSSNLGLIGGINNTSQITLTAPSSNFTSYQLSLPTSTGTNGQVLTSNGSGGTIWATPASAPITDINVSPPLILANNGTLRTISIEHADGSKQGVLSAADWNAFNNKISSQWTTSGSNISYSAGNVGIGTTVPGSTIDITGTFNLTDSSPALPNPGSSGSATALTTNATVAPTSDYTSAAGGYQWFFGQKNSVSVPSTTTATDLTRLYLTGFQESVSYASSAPITQIIAGTFTATAGTSGAVNNLIALSNSASITNSNSANVSATGVSGAVSVTGNSGSTGTLTSATGVNASVSIQSGNASNTFNIGNAYGVRSGVGVLNTASASITNAYGLYVDNGWSLGTPGGTITNQYGLYINDQTRGTTSKYNIYSAGQNGINYFGGNVGIGTTAPGSKLDVIGKSTLDHVVLNPRSWTYTGNNLLTLVPNSGNGTLAGSVAITQGSSTVTGTGTAFTTSFVVGDIIRPGSSCWEQRVISSIASDTSLTVETPFTCATGSYGYISFPTPFRLMSGNTANFLIDQAGGISSAGSMRLGGGVSIGSSYRSVNPPTDGMIIQGKLGIGTTSPSSSLHISSGTSPWLFLQTTNTSSSPSFNFLTSDGSSVSSITAFTGGSGQLEINNSMTGPLTLKTASSERMRIDGAGKVGIGTTSPTQALDVNGTVRMRSNLEMSSSNAYIGFNRNIAGGGTSYDASYNWAVGQDSNTPYGIYFRSYFIGGGLASTALYVHPNGFVGVGMAPSSYNLQVNGNVGATSAFVNYSDQRLKKNIATIPNALAKINEIRGVTYEWQKEENPEMKLSERQELGVVAQEVENIFPQVVSEDVKTGIKSVAYSMLIAPLIEAVKELYEKLVVVEKLQKEQKVENNEAILNLIAENRDLKLINAKQDKQIKDLEARLEKIERKSH